MEKLGLDIIEPYKCLYSFDSKRVQYLGMIKDLMVGMVQIPRKFVMMIIDAPHTYGKLLSRNWRTYMGGTIQLDIYYATILIVGAKTHKLYIRKPKMTYIISNPRNPTNLPSYTIDSLVNFLLNNYPSLVNQVETLICE